MLLALPDCQTFKAVKEALIDFKSSFPSASKEKNPYRVYLITRIQNLAKVSA